MLETIQKQWAAKVAVIFFVLLTIWWIVLQINGANGFQFDLFTISYGMMAAWGGFWGIVASKKWGFTQSVMGKGILCFAFGLLAQEFGQLAYTYYIYILNQEVPYPSLGDIGYFGSIIFYIAGAIYLAKASGAKFKLKSATGMGIAIIIPLIMLTISYIFFLRGHEIDWNNSVTVFLDFGYPLGQAIYISIAIATYFMSRKFLGGMMKNSVLYILGALVVQYIADYMFLYQASRGTWAISGLNDFVYFIAYFLMALALLNLITILRIIREK